MLSWAEVRAVWHSETLTWPARQAVRLLLLTGARVNEVCQASWSEFLIPSNSGELGLWTLPAARSKNHRTLLTPILPLAAEMLGELRDILPDSDWLFPARNCGGAVAPWGATALSHAVRNAGMDWKPQDLRRTFKTLAGGCGIGRDILDRIQNHAAQDVASRHYDRHEYIGEKRAALAVWERELSARVAGGIMWWRCRSGGCVTENSDYLFSWHTNKNHVVSGYAVVETFENSSRTGLVNAA